MSTKDPTCEAACGHIQFSYFGIQITEICRQSEPTISQQAEVTRVVSNEPSHKGRLQFPWLGTETSNFKVKRKKTRWQHISPPSRLLKKENVLNFVSDVKATGRLPKLHESFHKQIKRKYLLEKKTLLNNTSQGIVTEIKLRQVGQSTQGFRYSAYVKCRSNETNLLLHVEQSKVAPIYPMEKYLRNDSLVVSVFSTSTNSASWLG